MMGGMAQAGPEKPSNYKGPLSIQHDAHNREETPLWSQPSPFTTHFQIVLLLLLLLCPYMK